MPEGTTHTKYGRAVGGLTSAGVPGLLFWYMYLPVEEVTRTPQTLSYSESDCTDAIRKYGHLKVGDDYTFNDLWDNRISATMVPMEEGVVRAKWNNGGRVVLVGDVVHKVRPSSLFDLDMILTIHPTLIGYCKSRNGRQLCR